MPRRPLKVAFIAHYPACALLPREEVKPQYRNGEHPAPWVQLMADALARRDRVDVLIAVDSRAVTREHRIVRESATYLFTPKREPIRTDPFHGFRPAIARLRPHLEQFMPDLVLGFGAESGGGYIACQLPWPRVVFLQGIVEKTSSFSRRNPLRLPLVLRMERELPHRADGLIADTGFARDWAQAVNPAALVRVIPHPVNPSFLEVSPGFGEKRILSVGSLIPVKGVDTLIRAFARVPDPTARLVLAGDGPLRMELARLARGLGVLGRIHFIGFQDARGLQKEMRRASIFALASRMDTSPNALTEAHAAGLPVVATAAGGIPEMVAEGVDGHVVPVDDEAALGGHLAALLADPERGRLMGQAGRTKVRSLNDADRLAGEYTAFFAEILDRRAAAARRGD